MVLATDPPVSEAQRRAMWAAAEGNSTLGISPKVGKEFVGKDMKRGQMSALVALLSKFFGEEAEEPEHAEDTDFVNAAGVMATHPNSGTILFTRRKGGDHPGEWAFPGGRAEEGELPYDTARREWLEETGRDCGSLDCAFAGVTDAVNFHTYRSSFDEQFEPVLNDEHDAYMWARADAAPQPLHPGALRAIRAATTEPAKAEITRPKHAADSLAMDKSLRRYDKDGRLHVDRSNISKANVCEYAGGEIPDFEKYGLDPLRKYKLLRHPDELAKGAKTFNNLPILSKHVPISAKEHPKELTIGTTGSDVEFNNPYLSSSLAFWDESDIDDIEAEDKKELSSAYHYRADMTPGTYDGERYDGVMRDIVGNHVALVEKGRAGPDVLVADADPEYEHQKECRMNVALTRAAAVAKGAVLVHMRPRIATDAKIDFGKTLDGLTSKNFGERKKDIIAAVSKTKLAKDASAEGLAELLDALETDKLMGDDEKEEDKDKEPAKDEDEPEGMDEEGEFLKKKLSGDDISALEAIRAKKKEGTDAQPPNFAGKPKLEGGAADKKAMDAAIAAATDKAVKVAVDTANAAAASRRSAEVAVRPYVGELALDSAATGDEVYAAALKNLGVKIEGIHPSAFPAILGTIPKPGSKTNSEAAPAMDAAGVKSFDEMYPSAKRIRVAG